MIARGRPAGFFRAAAGLLLLIGAVMVWSLSRTAEVERDLDRADAELLRLESLSGSLHRLAEETSEYASLGTEKREVAVAKARQEAVSELAELRRVGQRPGLREWVEPLAPLVERRIAVSDDITAARRAGGAARSLKVMGQGEIDRLDDELERRLDALQEDVLVLREARRRRWLERRVATGVTVSLLVALSLALLGAAFIAQRRAEEALRGLAEALVRAEQKERRRIAQILHDHLQQTLAAAAMQVGRVAAHPGSGDAGAAAGAAAAILKDAAQTARALSYELCPPDIARGSMERALRWLGEQMQARHGLDVAVQVRSLPEALPDSLRDFVLTAARELLFNVVKHAGTRQAALTAASDSGWLRVEVADQGPGFDAERVLASAQGLGLADIRERAGLFGGSLDVVSRPGQGSRVALLLPLRPA